ncbi:Ubiquitin-conjugating enzyme E2, partial [Phytophthora palmivora]
LPADLAAYRVDIAALQETKICTEATQSIGNYSLITLKCTNPHYGVGFVVAPHLRRYVTSAWAVSDRIGVLQLRLRSGRMNIINAYAPHMGRSIEEADRFYADLATTHNKLPRRDLTFVLGDFNAKLGQPHEHFVGSWARGYRNRNGHLLAAFCELHELTATNTFFRKRAKNLTTWTQRRVGHCIYNQIDYVLSPASILKLCTNAHAWGGTLTNSDHKLVTADFNLRDVPRRRFQTHVARDEETRLARSRLYYDEDARTDYQRRLAAALQDDAETLNTASPQDRWDRILRHAYTSAEDSVGYQPAISKGRFADPQLKVLSYLQQQLRLDIYNNTSADVRQLRRTRNDILHAIRTRCLDLANQALDHQAEVIESLSTSSRVFEATRALFPNHLVREHFRSLFVDPSREAVRPDSERRPLQLPIDPAELKRAFRRLKNGRAAGPDTVAFDTIDRAKLMDVLRSFLDDDEVRLIQLLLADTTLSLRSGSTTLNPFTSNLGTPQGDSLSPVLFTVYLEAALRDLADSLDVGRAFLDDMIVYADDADFVCRTVEATAFIQDQAPAILARWSLAMNSSKTELTTVARASTSTPTRHVRAQEEVWRNTKKLARPCLPQPNVDIMATDLADFRTHQSSPVQRLRFADFVIQLRYVGTYEGGRDVREMMTNPSDQYAAAPLETNMFDWHFTLRGPRDTEFEGGIYHGRIILPSDYPFKPPNIMLLTPNGRFEVKKKICLSISAYHPEEWQPAWGVRLILEALISFMPTKGEGAIGALDFPAEERKRLAKLSVDYKCETCGRVADLLPELETESERAEEKKPSKYAEQIAQLHMHSLESASSAKDKKETVNNSAEASNTEEAEVPVVAEPEVIEPHQNVDTPVAANNVVQVRESDSVDTFLHYLTVAIVVALFALIYKKLLQMHGVLQ